MEVAEEEEDRKKGKGKDKDAKKEEAKAPKPVVVDWDGLAGRVVRVPVEADNLDGLDYLVGKTFTEINRKAYEGTLEAHVDGGVPAMTVWLDKLNATTLGEALYFFEHAVGVSGYLLGVNPFDQPGVEAYKQRMFRLLGKPGAK